MNILEHAMNIIEIFIIQMYEYLNTIHEFDYDENIELCNCSLYKKNA